MELFIKIIFINLILSFSIRLIQVYAENQEFIGRNELLGRILAYWFVFSLALVPFWLSYFILRF